MADLFAPRNYKPGDLIHCEKPFAKVLCRRMKDQLCEYCFQSSTDLKTCKKCLFVKYCEKSCQKKDWPDHQLECKHLKNLPEKYQDMVRLFGKVVLKTKGKDWKTITTEILGKSSSFEDIDPFYKEMTENPRNVLEFQEFQQYLNIYIGDENMPEKEDLIKIIGKVKFHRSRHLGNDVPWGYRFFLGSSAFDGECIPNSNIQYTSQQTLKIWAIRKIKKGKEKITISCNSILFSPLKQTDDCKCSTCSLPYGESVLTKIIDENRASSVISSTEEFLNSISSGLIPSFLLPFMIEVKLPELLQQHEGVLADTHILHLKLLGLCVRYAGWMSDILKLETIMRSIFGEYFLDMKYIYNTLFKLNIQCRNAEESRRYLQKIRMLEMHDTD